MEVTVRVELYGLCFPMVFEGPPWSEYEPSRNTSSGDWNPGVHVVELSVDDSLTLGRVINEAADEFGIRLSDPHFGTDVAKAISGVAFYREGDERLVDLPYDRFSRRLPSVDDEGRISFVDLCEATVAGLCRAGESGLLEADALRPYFRPTVPQGSPSLPSDWQQFVQAVQAVWWVLKNAQPLTTLSLVGLVPLLRRLHGRARAPGETIVNNRVSVLLARRVWNVDSASELVGAPVQEVATALATLGYRLDDDGIWRKTEKESGMFFQLALDLVAQTRSSSQEMREAELAALGRIAVRMYEETGEVPIANQVTAARRAQLGNS